MILARFVRTVATGLVGCLAAPAHGDVVTRVCLLTASQEVPPNGSTARGCGRFVIDTDTNTVTYEIVYWGLSSAETAAHVHGVANPGANAGVLVNLPLGTVKQGSFVYPEAQEAALLNGGMYVNVHSANFPGGEIRGQIVGLVCDLDGLQEVPPTPSNGQGVGLFNLDPGTGQLSYYIIYGGLSSAEIGAHIHGTGRHGVNAGVVHNLPAGSPKAGAWNYPSGSEKEIVDGLYYVNIHSVNFPGGEIRGQIVSWVDPLNALQEVPPNPSPAAGCALICIDRAAAVLTHDVRIGPLISAETAAHIHGFADPGQNAGVLQGLPLGARKLGQWAYGAANFCEILRGRTYVNVHSVNFPGGEIRGQLNRGEPIPCTPLITTHPSDTTVAAPNAVTLSVAALERNGGGLTYQWQRNGSNVPNAPPFFGSQSANLTINPSNPAFSGAYRCLVTNCCGTTPSNVANVVITSPPSCDPDVNCDGSADGFDVEVMEQAVGGDVTNFCQPDTDWNGDGSTDGFDVEAVEQVVGGSPCP
jgi:hypothetical protein